MRKHVLFGRKTRDRNGPTGNKKSKQIGMHYLDARMRAKISYAAMKKANNYDNTKFVARYFTSGNHWTTNIKFSALCPPQIIR